MPSKQWVRLPVSTTVGVTLLGLSATLFAVDVGGTIVLDNDRPGAERPASAVAAQRRAPAAAPAHTVVAAVIARAVPSSKRSRMHHRCASRSFRPCGLSS
jgi:hypothetical protein